MYKVWGIDIDKIINYFNIFLFYVLGFVGFGKRDDIFLDLWKVDGDSGDEEGVFCYLVINIIYGN